MVEPGRVGHRVVMRPFRSCIAVFLVCCLALALASCSGDDDSGSEAASKAAGAGAGRAEQAAPVDAALEFSLTKVGDKAGAGIPLPARATCTRSIPATCTGELTCPAAEGARDGDVELCAWLADRGRAALEPVGDDAPRACTMIYGGPEQATVTGTVGGEEVSQSYSREDGCAIARWEDVQPLWTGDVPAAADAAPDTTGARGAVGDPNATTSSPPMEGVRPEREVITDPPEAFDR